MSENAHEGMSEEELMQILTSDWGPAPAECGTCKKCYCDGSC